MHMPPRGTDGRAPTTGHAHAHAQVDAYAPSWHRRRRAPTSGLGLDLTGLGLDLTRLDLTWLGPVLTWLGPDLTWLGRVT